MFERFITITEDDVYYVADKNNINNFKSLTDYEKYFKNDYETLDELKNVALVEYTNQIYENRMDGEELVNLMNKIYNDYLKLKFEKENVLDYIEDVKQSIEKQVDFDEKAYALLDDILEVMGE